jgi:serine/threonine protein kinase
MTANSSLPPGTLLADKFRIERLLGAGAMGAVYAIDHELTRHKRALKLLHPDARAVPDLVRRFLNEASAAGRTGSPHLVETFDAGTLPSGEPYVVMELLEGETLGTVLDREGSLDVARAAELVAQAAEGIDAAHRAGIIHRDLKPDNLFVTAREGAPFVKILDFGVSKFATLTAASGSRTQAGMIYGSPAYMSPEQLTAQPDVDAKTDVFALGVVLFQSLTGKLPFDGPSVEALTVRLLTGQPTPIDTLRPDLPSGLVEVVRRALAPFRADRFPTARAFAEALAPFRIAVTRSTFAGLALAETLRSGAPPAGTPSLPPGVPRRRLGLLPVTGVAAVLVALATTLLMMQAKAPAGASVGPRPVPASPVLAVEPLLSFRAVPVTTTELAPLASASDTAARLAADPQKKKTSLASAPSASAVPAARPPAVQSLGLSGDNPFR